jgi:hypothetical protein
MATSKERDEASPDPKWVEISDAGEAASRQPGAEAKA